MGEELRDVLGWGSPIGLAIFFIGLGIFIRLIGRWGPGKKKE